ncbi:MAG: formate/nitrite transporter family protein, partial [Firmicutes bacterium]|nr:formate/nitrite transporter family protein [Bacillota bacterium]
FFIILPFVIGGFEHCVANMYFIPVGMMAATNEAYVNVLGLDVSSLTVGAFVLKNLVPVTIGNIIGGSGFVGMMYWAIHRK